MDKKDSKKMTPNQDPKSDKKSFVKNQSKDHPTKVSIRLRELKIDHYRVEIDQVVIECEQVYRSVINYELLEQKVLHLIMCADLDGITENEIWDIVQSRIPALVNYINYKRMKEKKLA